MCDILISFPATVTSPTFCERIHAKVLPEKLDKGMYGCMGEVVEGVERLEEFTSN
jgi:hypothetical protein